MGLSKFQVILCIGMLITGAINTLSKKAQNDCSAPGYPAPNSTSKFSPPHKFVHPWFQTLILFIGETFCLLGLCYLRWKERRSFVQMQNDTLMVSVNSSGVSLPHHTPVFQWIFLVPTIFDLFATSLAGIGLVYVDASIWQMLRSYLVVFTGILSRVFLRRKLTYLQWSGIGFATLGMVLVGVSGVLRSTHHPYRNTFFGVVLIISSQLVSAAQMIIEEIILRNNQYHPLQVVGMEGAFGVLLMAFGVLPAMYFMKGPQIGDRLENSLDALYQIALEPQLLIFFLIYLVTVAFFYGFGVAVTKHFTAVHRTLIDSLRTIAVWFSSMIIYYSFTRNFGEPFDKNFGIFQIDGFLFLLVGTAMYYELMYFPCVSWLDRRHPEVYPSLVGAPCEECGQIHEAAAAQERRPPPPRRAPDEMTPLISNT